MTRQTVKKALLDCAGEKGLTSLPSILFAASECAPLTKTGGLADVAWTLPKELCSLGFDCRVIIPFHRQAKEKFGQETEHVCDFFIKLGWRNQYVGIEKLIYRKVIIYLVDNEFYFGANIYKGGDAETEQYAFFQRAVLEALPRIGFIPDVLHCNDWHTALIPMLIKTQYQQGELAGVKTQLTIHNLAYQGKCGFGFIRDLLGLDERLNSPNYMEAYGGANCLKAGCVFADGLNTVSPSYAAEICTPEFGEGLDGLFFERRKELIGIINGIDKRRFDPATDKNLPANYSRKNPSDKRICKAELLRELGLINDPDSPLIGMVSRITRQKGFEALFDALPGIIDLGAIFVLLGAGNPGMENTIRGFESRYKGRFCAYIGYNLELASRIYAGSDFFLMPSLFEPCGISQMISMRYGTLPVVRETGGLRDTVIPYNKFTGEGTGFSYSGSGAFELYAAIKRALLAYNDEGVMPKLIDRAMSEDFGLERSALAYGKQYICLL